MFLEHAVQRLEFSTVPARALRIERRPGIGSVLKGTTCLGLRNWAWPALWGFGCWAIEEPPSSDAAWVSLCFPADHLHAQHTVANDYGILDLQQAFQPITTLLLPSFTHDS